MESNTPPMYTKAHRFSRRDFINHSLSAGVALPLMRLPVSGQARSVSGPSHNRSVAISVASPAGPAPLGAAVETSVPFALGQLRDLERMSVFAPDGRVVVTQTRTVMVWPDGSVRWAVVAFEPVDGPGVYWMREGKRLPARDMVEEKEGIIRVDNGEVAFGFSKSGTSCIEGIDAYGPEGKLIPIVRGTACADLVITRHDGQLFRASLSGETRKIVIEETGPVRAVVRIEGKCRSEVGTSLFDFVFRWRTYRNRPEVILEATWANTTESASEQVRDVRAVFPFSFSPARLIIGCERGVYDGPFLKDWPVYLLQEDHRQYWAKTINPDRQIQNLSSGGCNGEHCPGWFTLQDSNHALALWVPDFWEEYPNEIALRDGEASVGFWPERAVDHLLSNPVLPSNPFGKRPYSATLYWPIMPHPYVSFLDPQKKCLDARQGMAKTQRIILGVWGGRKGGPLFEKKWWGRALEPVRGHLEPKYVASTRAAGLMTPQIQTKFPQLEQLFEESFGWFERHTAALKCYGKFDYGDFHYFTAATDYMCHPGTKWGEMGEMAREGYWHNNERDPLRGLILYYLRTGKPQAWQLCEATARHLIDIDLRRYPHWGMWTHSYGHCYVAMGEGGEPDHSWLSGLLLWAALSGDPLTLDAAFRCGDRLASLPRAKLETDTRTASVHLHMMCQFSRHSAGNSYRRAADLSAEVLLQYQRSSGAWPAYLGPQAESSIEGFVEHAVLALADYYDLTGKADILAALDKALHHLYEAQTIPEIDTGESPLSLFALALLADKTGNPRYVQLAHQILGKLREKLVISPDPLGRGDLWAGWGIHGPEEAKASGRPPQLLNQTRPLVPATLLAYGQECMAILGKASSG